MMSPPYVGRFAPSPTGQLHFGSVLAAIASFVDARQHGGRWLVRMEDLDPPREQPGAADQILHTLEALSLHWDGEVMWQSHRQEHYLAALQQLEAAGWVYPCGCSRKDVASLAHAGVEGPVYPDTCRNGMRGDELRGWRVRTLDSPIHFRDRIRGHLQYNLHRDLGDFILRRADGLFAYQLAVVVDDAEQGITEVIRGVDLLHSTPRQIWLQQLLHLPTPHYAHLPLALSPQGQKLSKQNLALPVDAAHAPELWWLALQFLGQHPPETLWGADVATLQQWALTHWQLGRVPRDNHVAPEARGGNASSI